jgi:hypothetical protein
MTKIPEKKKKKRVESVLCYFYSLVLHAHTQKEKKDGPPFVLQMFIYRIEKEKLKKEKEKKNQKTWKKKKKNKTKRK